VAKATTDLFQTSKKLNSSVKQNQWKNIFCANWFLRIIRNSYDTELFDLL
jgi:hypothetical protein